MRTDKIKLDPCSCRKLHLLEKIYGLELPPVLSELGKMDLKPKPLGFTDAEFDFYQWLHDWGFNGIVANLGFPIIPVIQQYVNDTDKDLYIIKDYHPLFKIKGAKYYQANTQLHFDRDPLWIVPLASSTIKSGLLIIEKLKKYSHSLLVVAEGAIQETPLNSLFSSLQMNSQISEISFTLDKDAMQLLGLYTGNYLN